MICAISLIVHHYDLDCHYALGIRSSETLRKINADVKKKVIKL